ncbi:MAG TPA: ABC transporter ATP-binding protein [Syntrophales bacterium]|nr:ABC transporter ATP-binding protein [Syntrophales bacterium]
MKKKLIEVQNVTFGYNSKAVLENVSLDICEGDYILLLGPNGGGKTTLVKLIMGIYTPWKGGIRLDHSVINRLGYVPQSAGTNRNFPITVFDMVLTGLIGPESFLKRYSREQIKRAESVIERLELEEVRHTNIHDLSGGQMQRMLIARALVLDPVVIVLDEPTTSIDLTSQTNFLDLLRDLNRTKTIVVVTHDPTPYAHVYNHVACVNRNLYFHDRGELQAAHLEKIYGCPVELLGHGIPHVFLHHHEHPDPSSDG